MSEYRTVHIKDTVKFGDHMIGDETFAEGIKRRLKATFNLEAGDYKPNCDIDVMVGASTKDAEELTYAVQLTKEKALELKATKNPAILLVK